MTTALVRQVKSHWRAEHVAKISDIFAQSIPVINPASVKPLIPGLDLWDMWPIQLADNGTARFEGWTLWLVLSAPVLPDPDLRHGIARIRMIAERAGEFLRGLADQIGLADARKIFGEPRDAAELRLAAGDPEDIAEAGQRLGCGIRVGRLGVVDEQHAALALAEFAAAPGQALPDGTTATDVFDRLGSGRTLLMSPVMVIAAAVTGKITDPRSLA